MLPDPLAQPLTALLGETTAKALARAFDHRSAGDLLAHLPRRYAHRGDLTSLAGLQVGEEVTIVGTVARVAERSMQGRRGSLLEAVVGDGVGTISLTWFNQGWRARELVPGARGLFAGKVGEYRGALQLTHPSYQLFGGEEDEWAAIERAEWPIPIYPATGSLPSWRIAAAVGTVLAAMPPELPDPVPAADPPRLGFRAALEAVHLPHDDAQWQAGRAALAYQEALVLQTALVQRRDLLRAAHAVPRRPGALLTAFDTALPFVLTEDQAAAGQVIEADLAAERPMNRLVQGEVGSGKTLVALRAMLTVAESGGQAVLLAPTEVLAQQHLRSVQRSLGPALTEQLKPVLLTGRLPAAERKRALLAAASGQSRIVIGTHALLGDRVSFADLALVVVDEQHRFGVEQREALRAKGDAPHLLVLTATPIPRTVAMTVFGDLDVTTIVTLPAGRSPIESFVVPLAERPGWASRIWQRVAEELVRGRQAFVVVPSITAGTDEEDPDALADGLAEDPARPLAAVDTTLAHLQTRPELSGRRIAALHGRMPGEGKEQVMLDFADGVIDVLVATTVIEVGVDVPNASMMVVLDADRFGVSQLHQLRGRVGRGSLPGLALFVTSAEPGSLARERVDAVAATVDGFVLAERDLQLRQEGDVLGQAQSGRRSGLRLLSAATDGELIAAARDAAIDIVAADPELVRHPALAQAIARRISETEQAFLTRA